MPRISDTRPTVFIDPGGRYGAIALPNGEWCLVDAEVAVTLGKYRWHRDSNGYVQRMVRTKGLRNKWHRVCLHRVVMGLQDPETGQNFNTELEVDHRDSTLCVDPKLDNRRWNLETVTKSAHRRITQNRRLR